MSIGNTAVISGSGFLDPDQTPDHAAANGATLLRAKFAMPTKTRYAISGTINSTDSQRGHPIPFGSWIELKPLNKNTFFVMTCHAQIANYVCGLTFMWQRAPAGQAESGLNGASFFPQSESNSQVDMTDFTGWSPCTRWSTTNRQYRGTDNSIETSKATFYPATRPQGLGGGEGHVNEYRATYNVVTNYYGDQRGGASPTTWRMVWKHNIGNEYIRIAPAMNPYWSGTNYTQYVNDRSGDDMRGIGPWFMVEEYGLEEGVMDFIKGNNPISDQPNGTIQSAKWSTDVFPGANTVTNTPHLGAIQGSYIDGGKVNVDDPAD